MDLSKEKDLVQTSKQDLDKYFCAYGFLNMRGFRKQKDGLIVLSARVETEHKNYCISVAQMLFIKNKIKFKIEYVGTLKDNNTIVAEAMIIHKKYRKKVYSLFDEILDKSLVICGQDFIPALIDFQKMGNGGVSLYEEAMKAEQTQNKGKNKNSLKGILEGT